MSKHYFLSNYYIIDKIGGGSFGKVYRVFDIGDQKKYALKVMPINQNSQEAFTNEIQAQYILSSSSGDKEDCSKYVVCMKAHGIYDPKRDPPPPDFLDKANEYITSVGYRPAVGIYPNRSFFIAQELLDGDFLKLIEARNNTGISADVILFIMYKLLLGLSEIHNKGIAHQDIKPENILYSNDSDNSIEDLLQNVTLAKEHLDLKYGDLGLTCSLSDLLKICTNNGTLDFVAPEFAQVPEGVRRPAFEFAKKGDLWALGLTLWSLVFGDHPLFPLSFEIEMGETLRILRDLQGSYEEIFMNIYGSPSTDEKAVVINTVLKSLLEVNPEERIDAKDLVIFMEEESPILLASERDL